MNLAIFLHNTIFRGQHLILVVLLIKIKKNSESFHNLTLNEYIFTLFNDKAITSKIMTYFVENILSLNMLSFSIDCYHSKVKKDDKIHIKHK